MTLDKSKLLEQLPGASGDYPATRALCAKAWANAAKAWASGITPPSTAVNAAAAALETAILAAFSSPLAAPQMDTAFMQFATAIGIGMAPTFVGTPPGGPPGFAALFALPPPATRAEGNERVANLLHVWMKTGTAALAAPPNTAQPWA